MPKNVPQRGPSQEERRRRSANRPIGGGGAPKQPINKKPASESYSSPRIQRMGSIIAIVMLVAMLLSLVPACYYSSASAAVLPGNLAPAVQGQTQAATHLSLASTRYLEQEPAEGPPTASLAGPTAALPAAKYYAGETGHYISGTLLKYWLERGGQAQFGNPLSEEFIQNGFTVQLFERALLEAHPNEPAPQYQVQLGFLGRQLADARGLTFESVQSSPDTPTRTFFKETGQAVAGLYKAFWESHDGLNLLGLPISGELTQNGVKVQYFERGLLQTPPGAATPEIANAGELLIEARNWPRPTLLNLSLNLGDNEIYQGRTLAVRLEPASNWVPLALKGSVGQEALRLFPQGSLFKAFKAFAPTAPAQTYPLKVSYTDPAGRERSLNRDIKVVEYNFKLQNLYLPSEKEQLAEATNDEADNAQLAATYATFSPNLLWTGKWSLPAVGEVTTEFGEKRAYGDSTDYNYIHGGIDYALAQGTPVYAPADGKVIFTADNMLVRGNAVALDHGAGVTSYYFHLSSYPVKPGDVVKKGQLIGKVGTTGRSNGPHLHWEVRVNGIITYPLLFVNLDLTN
jgi:murein DD-endopeptidase MepM/ murein hydrolase activator NlpD